MRLFKFAKPKTPGFGISKEYYLTVLASRATLPPIASVAQPKGENGAVPGFAVPLRQGTDKAALGRPMERGEYAVASVDRKSVLRLRVLSKEEAGFDPEPLARSRFAAELDPEVLARARATWMLMQLTFESHDASVYPSLDFILLVARRLAAQSEGVVADAVAQRYLLPEAVFANPRIEPLFDAREHVSVRFEASREGWHAYTLGLQKFALPEFEIYRLAEGDGPAVLGFLTGLTQAALRGEAPVVGDSVGTNSAAFEVRQGGLDRGQWEGIACLELLPPAGTTPSAALAATGFPSR